MSEHVHSLSPKGNVAHFAQYGKHFQEKVFQCLLTDSRWAAQMAEVMHPDYFELRYLNFLSEKYFAYFTKYRTFPTQQLLVNIARESLVNDSDIILKESDETLNKVLATIQKLPADQRYLIEGHTDDRGSGKHNHDLSARRAKSVVRWFAKKGINAKRFDTAGYGEDRPIATNDTDEGRKANRRVEIHLVDAKK